LDHHHANGGVDALTPNRALVFFHPFGIGFTGEDLNVEWESIFSKLFDLSDSLGVITTHAGQKLDLGDIELGDQIECCTGVVERLDPTDLIVDSIVLVNLLQCFLQVLTLHGRIGDIHHADAAALEVLNVQRKEFP
jgi:hypothetical protein